MKNCTACPNSCITENMTVLAQSLSCTTIPIVTQPRCSQLSINQVLTMASNFVIVPHLQAAALTNYSIVDCTQLNYKGMCHHLQTHSSFSWLLFRGQQTEEWAEQSQCTFYICNIYIYEIKLNVRNVIQQVLITYSVAQ